MDTSNNTWVAFVISLVIYMWTFAPRGLRPKPQSLPSSLMNESHAGNNVRLDTFALKLFLVILSKQLKPV